MPFERRSVSLTNAGPDVIVVGIQLPGPDGTPPDSLRARPSSLCATSWTSSPAGCLSMWQPLGRP